MSRDEHSERDPRRARDPLGRPSSARCERGSLELIVVRPSEGEPDDARVGPDQSRGRARRRPLARERASARRRDPRSPQPADAHVHRRARPDRRAGALAALGRQPARRHGPRRESLPAGSRLAIGDEVVVEVSEEPHTGCAKFSARFGSDALKFINSPEGRVLRLRGANARVIVPGTISTGDAIRRV